MDPAWRERVWARYVGVEFRSKCYTVRCTSIITPFQFSIGYEHGQTPARRGDAPPPIDDVRPVCATCAHYAKKHGTFAKWNEWHQKTTHDALPPALYVVCSKERLWRCFFGEVLFAHCLHCMEACSVFTYIRHGTMTCDSCLQSGEDKPTPKRSRLDRMLLGCIKRSSRVTQR